MSEQVLNLYASVLAVAYATGDGQITVSSATGLPAGAASYTVAIVDGSGSPLLLFRVSARAGTVLTGTPETTDANCPIGSPVRGSIFSAAAMAALGAQAAAGVVYGDALTAPTTATFGTAAQGANASNVSFADDTAGGESGVLLKADSTSDDTNIVLRAMAVPVAPWNIRVRFRANCLANNYPIGGFVFYDGAKALVFGYSGRDGTIRARAATFATLNSYDGSINQEFAHTGLFGRAGLIDLYVQDDGANRILSIISDGVLANRRLFFSGVNTGYLTPTHIGICVGPGHNSSPAGAQQAEIKVIDWTQS